MPFLSCSLFSSEIFKFHLISTWILKLFTVKPIIAFFILCRKMWWCRYRHQKCKHENVKLEQKCNSKCGCQYLYQMTPHHMILGFVQYFIPNSICISSKRNNFFSKPLASKDFGENYWHFDYVGVHFTGQTVWSQSSLQNRSPPP